MPKNKKPRKAYKPMRLAPGANPLAYVLESLKPVREHESYLIGLKMTNHSAMSELTQGRATNVHVGVLIGMSNMIEGLWRLGFGKEYEAILVAGQRALDGVCDRAARTGRYVLTGPEITALNDYMELHDAQMEVVCVKDIERALDLARKSEAAGLSKRLTPHKEHA